MNLRVALTLIVVLASFLCWALWVRAPASAEREGVAAVERSAEAEILARLARIETALGERGDAGLAAALPPSTLAAASPLEARRVEQASLPAAPPVDLAPLEAEIAALARAVEALQQVVRSSETSAKFPSLELLRSASEPNWEQLDVLVGLEGSQEELQARVHWLSQEEVLATYGRPDWIDSAGQWHYEGQKAGRKAGVEVTFHFISNYVDGIH